MIQPGKLYYSKTFRFHFKLIDTYNMFDGSCLVAVIEVIDDPNKLITELFSKIPKGEHPEWAGYFSVPFAFLEEISISPM